MSAPHEDPGFDVVLVGSGLGVYALTRAFHEQYGLVSTVVTKIGIGPLLHSVTCRTIELGPTSTPADMVASLVDLARKRPEGRPALLLCNADSMVQFLSDHREVLSEHYAIPVVDGDTLDRISDKAEFSQICTALGIPTPATQIIDFAEAGTDSWSAPASEFGFPVVGKAAKTSEYAHITMPGKKKVYFFHSQQEVDRTAQRLADAGFRGRFLLQELVPGDDTGVYSLTAYRDRHGRVTLLCSAQVLLEEHTPDALGRPAAMITGRMPGAREQVEAFLTATDYVGFANFDGKVDPRDGVFKYFEINPRIGRNCHYVTAAGANIAQFVAGDQIENREVEPVDVDREILYCLVPLRLLRRYVLDPGLRTKLAAAAGRLVANPWRYRVEGAWMHGYALAAKLNHVRKFRKYYPRPTDSGF